jgi:hypothetical protein
MATAQSEIAYLDHGELRQQFDNYAETKVAEQKEQRLGRLYYHASHWTSAQLEELKLRNQPPSTTPLFARKINGFIGLVERMRQDPKAYPRTEKEGEGAELCTAALRFVFEQQEWDAISPAATLDVATAAIGGVELSLEPGDSGVDGDYDISLAQVASDTFFYDPRSFKLDFSDARYMGVAKWIDRADAVNLWPDSAKEIDRLMSGQGAEFVLNNDRNNKWVNFDLKQIFVVEHWYRSGDTWLYAVYCGDVLFDQGETFLFDQKGRGVCRFLMWRAFVDQDGDAYSFLRNMRSLIDEINQRNSKAFWLLAARRVKAERGSIDDIEKYRREASRADGVMLYNPGTNPPEHDDARALADMRALLEMREISKSELENFGPNPALVGQGVEQKSGRAIALMQQAGIAELGPFMIGYRNWKIRVYRAVWNAIRQYWHAERWIRVTDAFGDEQIIQVNGMQVDPMTGMQQMVNKIGALDVDIRIDEGPDQVNMQADALEVLQAAAAQGQQIPPQVMIELLPLQDSMKKKLVGMIQQAQQPPPGAQETMALQLAELQAKVREIEASAVLKQAQAMKAANEAGAPQGMGETGPSPIELNMQASETAAKTHDLHAAAYLKEAQTAKVVQDIQLAPEKMAQEAAIKRQALQQRAAMPERRAS